MNRGVILAAILVFTISVPNMASGDNMNLSGSVNLNEVQNISTSNLLLSMLVSLAESIIPILIGAIVGHKTIGYWHKRKSEIATRESIISNYAQSFKLCNALQDSFVNRVFESCVTFEKTNPQLVTLKEYSYDEYGIQGFLKFPEADGLPSKRFMNEYIDLISETDKTAHAKEHLYSYLMLYKDFDSIMPKLDDLGDSLSRSKIMLCRFLNSTNADDFVKFHDSYLIESKKIAAKMKDIDAALIQLRFR